MAKIKTHNGERYSLASFVGYEHSAQFQLEEDGAERFIWVYTTNTSRDNTEALIKEINPNRQLTLKRWNTKEEDLREREMLDEIIKGF